MQAAGQASSRAAAAVAASVGAARNAFRRSRAPSRYPVIVRDCAHNLVLSPPLSITDEEADEVVDAIGSVLERLRPDGSYAG